MTYRAFVTEFMARRRPTTLAQGRAALRDAAAAWREMRRLANPRRNRQSRKVVRLPQGRIRRTARILPFPRPPRPPRRAANPAALLAVPAVELLSPAVGAAMVLNRGHEALRRERQRNPRCPACARAVVVPSRATSGRCPHCRASLRVRRS